MNTIKSLAVAAAALAALSSCAFNINIPQLKESFIKPSGNIITKDTVVAGFDTLEIRNSFNVTYVQADGTPEVRIETSDNIMPYVLLEQEDGNLKIRLDMKNNRTISINGGVINVYVTSPNLVKLIMGGSSDFTAKDTLRTSAFSLTCWGSSDVNFGSIISEGAFESSISGSGDVNVNGLLSCSEFSLRITGSGEADVDNLSCGAADLTVSGSGDMEFDDISTESVNVAVTGSGNVNLAGKTKRVNAVVSGSGDINLYGLKYKEIATSVSGSGDIRRSGDSNKDD